MNLGQLGATLTKNKPALLGVGAAGAVGFGLYSRRKAAAIPADVEPAGASTPAGLSGGGQTYGLSGAGGVYDSSASDLYGAIAPQLESLQGQLTGITDRLNATPSTIPVPHPVRTPAPAPVKATPNPVKKTTTPTRTVVPVPVKAPAAAGPQYVTVKAGDTLSGISARYKETWITPGSIAKLNGIANPNVIRPGQKFRIF